MVTASARILSARTCPDSHPFLPRVCHPSSFSRPSCLRLTTISPRHPQRKRCNPARVGHPAGIPVLPNSPRATRFAQGRCCESLVSPAIFPTTLFHLVIDVRCHFPANFSCQTNNLTHVFPFVKWSTKFCALDIRFIVTLPDSATLSQSCSRLDRFGSVGVRLHSSSGLHPVLHQRLHSKAFCRLRDDCVAFGFSRAQRTCRLRPRPVPHHGAVDHHHASSASVPSTFLPHLHQPRHPLLTFETSARLLQPFPSPTRGIRHVRTYLFRCTSDVRPVQTHVIQRRCQAPEVRPLGSLQQFLIIFPSDLFTLHCCAVDCLGFFAQPHCFLQCQAVFVIRFILQPSSVHLTLLHNVSLSRTRRPPLPWICLVP